MGKTKYRKIHANPLSIDEIKGLEKGLGISFPSDYKNLLMKFEQGELAFNTTKVTIDSNSEAIGIDCFLDENGITEAWNNLINYEEFRDKRVIPTIALLSPRTLCIGYDVNNQNKLFIMETDLSFKEIQENLSELIDKIEYV